MKEIRFLIEIINGDYKGISFKVHCANFYNFSLSKICRFKYFFNLFEKSALESIQQLKKRKF